MSQSQSQFKLVVAAVVSVPIKFNTKEAGKTVSHFFHLDCKRLEQQEALDRLEHCSATDFIKGVAEGWNGQRLVNDTSTGQPAEFSPEALDAMLGLWGLGAIALKSYLNVVGGIEKN